MVHPLVEQLRFARSEFKRGLEGLSDAEACHRFEPMNAISWMIGHMAWQEQAYWLEGAQSEAKVVVPELYDLVAYGAPATTPPLGEMWAAWRAVTQAADLYLDTLTTEDLQQHYTRKGRRVYESAGTLLRRTTYHYWYHTGESQAVRQLLGHANLPDFVGDIGDEAPYRPE